MLSTAFNSTMNAVIVTDPQSRILYSNARAQRLLGYTADDLQTMRAEDILIFDPSVPRDAVEGLEHARLQRGLHRGQRHVGLIVLVIVDEKDFSELCHVGISFRCASLRSVSRPRQDLLQGCHALVSAIVKYFNFSREGLHHV